MPGVPQQSIIANANYKFLSAGNLNINHVWKESTYNMADFDNNGPSNPPSFQPILLLIMNLVLIAK